MSKLDDIREFSRKNPHAEEILGYIDEITEDIPPIPVNWILDCVLALIKSSMPIENLEAGFLVGILVAWARENKPACGPDCCEVGGTDEQT